MTWASICRPEPSAVRMGPEYQHKADWEGVKVAQELMRSQIPHPR